MKVCWGDIHAHCGVSYGHGTPDRALQVARQHLDFCSITGHAFWPDLPMDLDRYDRAIGTHLGGFAKLQYYWKDLLALLKESTVPGTFVAFPSYEWHSTEFGDYNCYYNSYDAPLTDGPDVDTLERNLRAQEKEFLLIPHHCGYARGYRGMNWEVLDPVRSPLIEVYSNHGCGEADDAYYEYHHSMGPRMGESLLRNGLIRGRRFGFVGGTDNHDGYPGHYGHGRVGVIAERLDMASIWDALKNRRTIAATGARIAADIRLGSKTVGEAGVLPADAELSIALEGNAPIEAVEVVEGAGVKWHVRRLPAPNIVPEFRPGRYKVKIEAGWGSVDTPTDWSVRAQVQEGALLGCEPCFRNSAVRQGEQSAADAIEEISTSHAVWRCRSVPNPAGLIGGTHFDAGGTQSVVLDIGATEQSRLLVSANGVALDLALPELAERSTGKHTGPLGSTALKVHRAVPEREFSYRYRERYRPPAEEPGFLYVRVRQIDGQMAWVSPIWFT